MIIQRFWSVQQEHNFHIHNTNNKKEFLYIIYYVIEKYNKK